MLILSRKSGESVVVLLPDGRKMHVTVVEHRGDKVRLSFLADRDIVIHRLEVFNVIEAEKEKDKVAST